VPVPSGSLRDAIRLFVCSDLLESWRGEPGGDA